MKLRQFQAFLAVAKRRSFSRAADDIHLSQPALSTRIRGLEAELGLKLFSRTTRAVQLTPDGERLYARASRVLAELDAVVHELQDTAALRRGRVTIACVPAITSHLLPHAIKAFLSRHPQVDIEFKELTSAEVEIEVVRGHVDFGVGGAATRQPELMLEPLTKDPFVALVPLDHPLASREWVTLRMLTMHPLVVMREGSNVRSSLLAAFETIGLTLQPNFETTHHYSLAGMVRVGLGIGMLPMMTLASLDRSGLKILRIVRPVIERDICTISRKGIAFSPAAGEFIRTLREAVPHEWQQRRI